MNDKGLSLWPLTCMFDQSHCRFMLIKLVDNLCVNTQHNWANNFFYPNSTLIDLCTPLIKCFKLNILLPNKKICLKLHNGCISKFSTNANALDYFYTSPNINYTSKTDILALMVNSSPRGLKRRGGPWQCQLATRWIATNFCLELDDGIWNSLTLGPFG